MRRLVIEALLALGVVLALSACQRLGGVVDVAAGEHFSCSLHDDGTVRCWGDDSLGQLGDGQRGRDPQGPVMVIATPGAAPTNPLQRVAEIAGGVDTACALLTDGSLRCWGSNRSGALGIGSTGVQSGPVPVSW